MYCPEEIFNKIYIFYIVGILLTNSLMQLVSCMFKKFNQEIQLSHFPKYSIFSGEAGLGQPAYICHRSTVFVIDFILF
jgi:hypothetical protein